MQLGKLRLGNKGTGGVAGAISSVLKSAKGNEQDLNVAIDSLEEDNRKNVEESMVEEDVKIEKSSQFDDYLDEIENEYDDEGDENEDE